MYLYRSCMYSYTCMYAFMIAHTYLSMYVNMAKMYVCIPVKVFASLCMQLCKHVSMHACIQTPISTTQTVDTRYILKVHRHMEKRGTYWRYIDTWRRAAMQLQMMKVTRFKTAPIWFQNSPDVIQNIQNSLYVERLRLFLGRVTMAFCDCVFAVDTRLLASKIHSTCL